MKKLIFLAILFLGTSMIVEAQSSKKGKQSKLDQAYENLTANYNGYFNAKLRLSEGITKLSNQHQDNYNQVLSLYKYTQAEDVKSVAQGLDEAIIKAATNIKLHPTSHFTDDLYLLIGEAQYLKKDYETAANTFNYIITNFDPENLENNKNISKADVNKLREKERTASKKEKVAEQKQKKKERELTTKEKNKAIAKKRKERQKEAKRKKKEREKARKNKNKAITAKKKTSTKPKDPVANIPTPNTETTPKIEAKKPEPEEVEKAKSYFLKHRPIRQDAMVWLARTYIEMGRYDEANVWINRLNEDNTLTNELKGEMAVMSAYYYLKQKKYGEAISYIESALPLMKDRTTKIRANYILAQIHQLAGNNEKAAMAFQKVIKLRPEYEMEFSARLSMIKNSWTDIVDVAAAEKDLEALLKDEKNEEYHDLIYFTLADLAYNSQQEKKAISYLKKSLANNINNQTQKGESYLMLANIYFNNESYVNAKNYYDSTLMVFKKNDDRYYEIDSRAKSLTDIANNISIIELNDSLLAIKQLIDDNKETEFLALAQKINDERNKAKQEGQSGKTKNLRPTRGGLPTIDNTRLLTSQGGQQQIGRFWAYDDNKVRKGKREFTRVWGDRQLTDNWRRSSTSSETLVIEETETQEVFDLTAKEALNLFKGMGVPQDEKAVKTKNEEIIEAMAALGGLYKNRLEKDKKSIDILEQLLARYPTNKYKMEAYYSLYLLYKDANNQNKANYYKNLILTEGKATKFAEAIKNPNFAATEEEKSRQADSHYAAAYDLFQKGEYKKSRDKLDNAAKLFGETMPNRAKFELLAAMCTGGVDGTDAYELALRDVIRKYPDTPEQEKAQQILNIIKGKDKPKVNKPTTPQATTGFSVDMNSSHFIIVQFDESQVKQRDAKVAASDYNQKYHRTDRLRISNFLIDLKTPTLIIRRFANGEAAMKYIEEITKNKDEFLGGSDVTIIPVAINQDNYKFLLGNRTQWETYKQFFLDNYGEK